MCLGGGGSRRSHKTMASAKAVASCSSRLSQLSKISGKSAIVMNNLTRLESNSGLLSSKGTEKLRSPFNGNEFELLRT